MIDIDEIYDELEDLGIKYSAHEVSQAIKGINWKINEEDIPYCIAGLLLNKVQLANVQLITYDEGEFTEWLENEQSKFDGGYQVVDHAGTIRYFGWKYGSRRTQELFIQKKVIFTTRKPMTESKKPVKKNLKEDVGGCFYVIHERPIGHKGYQGWIDEYSELTSDIDSAEQYDTLQDAIDMLYAIEDYVGNFNDGEGIRATIQCVNPDADQVVEDVAAVDIQKCCDEVYCEIVLGEQNLSYCGYGFEDSGPSMGYNQ